VKPHAAFLCANSSHAAFSLFVLVVQEMLYSSHGDVQEQENTTPQAALKAACGCGATCLLMANFGSTDRDSNCSKSACSFRIAAIRDVRLILLLLLAKL
jgi:hypothetical protein